MSDVKQVTIGHLEEHFKQFPDVPREIILKQDLLRLGQRFSIEAMDRATGSLSKSYRLFSYDLVTMEQLKHLEHKKIPEWFMIRGGNYGLRPVVVQTSLALDTPYLIDVIDGSLRLCADGIPICEVGYPRSMGYYNQKFEDGTTYQEIIAYGGFITVFRYCQYWGPEEECLFCDINVNARQMKRSRSFTFNAPVKPISYVAAVANAVEQEMTHEVGFPIPLDFVVTGGTIIDELGGKKEDEFYLEYIEAIKWGGHRRFIALQTNAKDKETLRRYRAAGLDSHHPNMEVWGRRLFEWICPGKARRVGWEQWLRCTLEAVDIFGEGNVRPNFVCGVEMARPNGFTTVSEAVKSTTEGIDLLMSHGVFPRFNMWRREPRSSLVGHHDQPPIPLEFYTRLMRNYFELWQKYGLPLPRRNQAHIWTRVMGVGHGTYDDYILLNRVSNYTERVDNALKEGLKACISCWVC